VIRVPGYNKKPFYDMTYVISSAEADIVSGMAEQDILIWKKREKMYQCCRRRS